MSSYLKPIEVCERLFGGLEDVAVAAGKNPKSAYVWRQGSKYRAAGDIPVANMRALLSYSDRRNMGLTARHLILGAPETEITAILAARSSAPPSELVEDGSGGASGVTDCAPQGEAAA